MSVTLLIGGARSGKSDLAVQLGIRHAGTTTHGTATHGAGVVFVATAQHFDDDMTARIERHRDERPPWPTIEAPLDVASALQSVPDEAFVIVDCLTLWVSNAMLAEWSDDAVREVAASTAKVAAARRGSTVVVTNEVGLGVHPELELGRRYRDLLGRVNRQWADVADRSLFLVAGRAVLLHDPWELLS